MTTNRQSTAPERLHNEKDAALTLPDGQRTDHRPERYTAITVEPSGYQLKRPGVGRRPQRQIAITTQAAMAPTGPCAVRSVAFDAAASRARQRRIRRLRRTISGRVDEAGVQRAPQTKPICTPIVSQEMAKGEKTTILNFNSGVTAVAENHVVSDRTIAIDSIARTPQREASELRCKSDAQVDGVVCTWLRCLRSWWWAFGSSLPRSRSESAVDPGPTRVDREFSRSRGPVRADHESIAPKPVSCQATIRLNVRHLRQGCR